jgi:hypothetical protein
MLQLMTHGFLKDGEELDEDVRPSMTWKVETKKS